MAQSSIPELWEWTEYYCPWSYITAVRLNKVAPEYEGRVQLVEKAFPLEVYGGGPPNRQEIEQEMWLAALQEPAAVFKPFQGDWPATTLPAFDGAWCALQQGDAIGRDFDLRIRRAFFAEGRNIGDRDVILDIAREAELDMLQFAQLFDGGQARAAVLEEGRRGKEQYGVRGTPTIMTADGVKLQHAIVEPEMQDGRIVSVGQLPCYGEECYAATRRLFEEALQHQPASKPR